MTDEEKIAEHKLVGSLMASEQKMGFSVKILFLNFLTLHS